MDQLSLYEVEAIKVVSSSGNQSEILLAQLVKAQCASRDYTGVGLYTNIIVDSTAPTLNLDYWKIEDFPNGYAEHPELPAGIGIILWLKDGYMTCLESYTYEGEWPKNEALFRVST